MVTEPVLPETWKILFENETVGSFNETFEDASYEEASYYIGIIDGDVDLPQPSVEYQRRWTVGSGHAKSSYILQNNREYKGSFTWEVQTAQLFENIFGKVTVSGTTTYTHTFTAGDQDARPLPSIRLAAYYTYTDGATLVGSDDIAAKISGVKLPKTTFSFAENEALKCEAEIWASTVSQAANSTTYPTVPTLTAAPWDAQPYMMKNLWDGTTAGVIDIGGVNYARVKSGSVSIDHQPEYRWYGNANGDPYSILEGRMLVTAEFTVDIENRSLWDKVIASPIAEESTIDVGFSRAADDTLLFTLDNCYILPKHTKGQAYATEATITVEGFDLTCVVVDLNATYPV